MPPVDKRRSAPSRSSGQRLRRRAGRNTDVPPAVSTSTPQDEQAAFKIFWEAWQTLKTEYYGTDLPDAKNLAYNAIRGVIFGLEDQFTSFVTPSSAKLIEEDATGSFSGIGAVVQLNKQRVLANLARVFRFAGGESRPQSGRPDHRSGRPVHHRR